MNSPNELQERVIKRILVAIDASPNSLAALETAARYASRFQAELVGIFVEDINLVRLSEMPFACEMGYYSATRRPLDYSEVIRQMRVQARWAQRAIELLAERANISWSFRTVRGLVASELLTAATEADILILGKTGWSRKRNLGSTARVIIAQPPRQAMVLQAGVDLERPILVIYDGSPNSKQALTTAINLQTEGIPIMVVLLTEDAETAQQHQSDIQSHFQSRETKIRYYWLPKMDIKRLAQLARLEQCSLFIIPTQSSQISGENLLALMNAVNCAVLLVR